MLFLCILLCSNFLITKQNFVASNITVVADESLSKGPNLQPTNRSNVSQIVDRSLVYTTNSSRPANESKTIIFEDFKPSPQFSTGYGYDRNEKPGFNTFSNNWLTNERTENPKRQEVFSPKVKFPTTTSVERPYTFENNYEKSISPIINNPKEFTYNHSPYEKSIPPINSNPIELTYNHLPSVPVEPSRPKESIWKKFFGFTGIENKQKTFYDNNFLEQQPYYHGYYEPPREYHHHQHSMEPHGGTISPFKKILKVLATLIPIGLFLSALTPTVITVSSLNNTVSRNNRKINAEQIMEKITNSLNSLKKLEQDGCEQKVICELMVNAMFSKNAEEHIKNLLNNFVKKEEGAKDETNSIQVLEAVKNQDCSSLICNVKDNPI